MFSKRTQNVKVNYNRPFEGKHAIHVALSESELDTPVSYGHTDIVSDKESTTTDFVLVS